jgi:hypothetical protein
MRASVLFCLIFSFCVSANGEAVLKNSRFTTCQDKVCIEVLSGTAVQGHLGPSLYFISPRVRVFENGKSLGAWPADSVFFDAVSNRLFIRSIERNHKLVDAYFDIEQGRLHFVTKI